jgi:hypothetical protein
LKPFVDRLSAAVIGVVLLAGCGSSSGTSPSTPAPASASAAPAKSTRAANVGPYAVLVHRAGGAEPYVVQLVRGDGHALPAVHAVARSKKAYLPNPTPCASGCSNPLATTANYQLPETSVSATHVYYLDGEADVKSLSPAGTVALVRHFDVAANSNLAFAVSPDDRRIAVAVITYATGLGAVPFSLSLWVEDLGGGHRTEVFTSTSVVEWPVGWHADNLVVAIGDPGVYTGFNPYGAVEYHLVDSATWTRQAVLTCAFGPLVAAGTACWKRTVLGRQDWTGTIINYRLDPAGPLSRIQATYLALSPDGRQIAGGLKVGSDGGYDTELFEDGAESLLVPGAAPLGWLDGSRLLVLAPAGPSIAAVPSGALTPVTGLMPLPGQGWPSLLGVLPAYLG